MLEGREMPFPEIPVVETERLVIREMKESDVGAMYKIFSDPNVLQHVAVNPFTSMDDAKKYVKSRTLDKWHQPRTSYEFALVSKESGEVVGVNMLQVDLRDKKAQRGIFLMQDAWGKGYATEAQLALMEYGFSKLGLHKIWATCDPENTGSKHEIEKTGMKFIARKRDDKWIATQNRYRDSLEYDLLDSEWQAFKQSDTPLQPVIAKIKILDNSLRVEQPKQSDTNSRGIEGYTPPRDLDLCRHDFETQVITDYWDKVFHELCPIEIDDSRIPYSRVIVLGRAVVTELMKRYGVTLEQLGNPSIVIGRPTHKNGIYTVESFDAEGNFMAIYPPRYWESDIHEILEQNYNIPSDASKEYYIAYLVAHSFTHAVQRYQSNTGLRERGMLNASEFPNTEQGANDYLRNTDEIEAHQVGVEMADKIVALLWEQEQVTNQNKKPE